MEASSQRLKWWQVIVVLLVIAGMISGGYLLYHRVNASGSTVSTSSNGLPTGTQLVTINTGNIMNSVSASGSVGFSTSDNLSFNISGSVDKVNVAAGDTVKKGQVLATLQSVSLTPLQLAVAQARVTLKSAQDNLSNSQNQTAAINQAKLAVANAQVALNTSQTGLANALAPYTQSDIDGAKLTIANAQVALNTSQTSLANALAPYTQSDIDAAKLAVANAQVSLNASQTSLANALAPYTQSDIDAANLTVANAQVSLKTAQDNLTTAQTPHSQSDIDAAQLAVYNAQVAVNTAQANYDTAWNTYRGNTTDDNMFAYIQKQAILVVSQNNLATAQQNLANMQAAPDPQVIAQKQAALVVAQNNLTTAQQNLANILAAPDPKVIAQKQAAVVVAQNNLTQAQKNLADMQAAPDARVIAQKQAALIVAQNNLAIAQQNLTDMLAAPDPRVIAQKQAAVVVAQDNLAIAQQNLANLQPDVLAIALLQAKLNDAQQSLNNAIDTLNTTMNAGTAIKAPYDGIMTAVKLLSGQQVTSGSNIMTIVSTAAAQVNAVVNEIDFPNIKVGQPVTISVDALSNNSFTGNVSSLSVFGTNSQGVVSYPITMSIDMQPGVTLGQGMSATGTIIFSQVNNVLVIPNRAIGGTNANPTVSVMVNRVLQSRPVTLGLTDGTNTQVISGLQAGDRVLEATTASRTGAGGAGFGVTGGPAIPGVGGAIPGVGGGGGAVIRGVPGG